VNSFIDGAESPEKGAADRMNFRETLPGESLVRANSVLLKPSFAMTYMPETGLAHPLPYCWARKECSTTP
jgi:hypothetical protein